MLQNTYLYEKRMFTSKASEHIIISGGKGKEIALIKRVKLTQEFEEIREVMFI